MASSNMSDPLNPSQLHKELADIVNGTIVGKKGGKELNLQKIYDWPTWQGGSSSVPDHIDELIHSLLLSTNPRFVCAKDIEAQISRVIQDTRSKADSIREYYHEEEWAPIVETLRSQDFRDNLINTLIGALEKHGLKANACLAKSPMVEKFGKRDQGSLARGDSSQTSPSDGQ